MARKVVQKTTQEVLNLVPTPQVAIRRHDALWVKLVKMTKNGFGPTHSIPTSTPPFQLHPFLIFSISSSRIRDNRRGIHWGVSMSGLANIRRHYRLSLNRAGICHAKSIDFCSRDGTYRQAAGMGSTITVSLLSPFPDIPPNTTFPLCLEP